MAQKWYEKASVQQALVAGVFLIITAIIGGIFGVIPAILDRQLPEDSVAVTPPGPPEEGSVPSDSSGASVDTSQQGTPGISGSPQGNSDSTDETKPEPPPVEITTEPYMILVSPGRAPSTVYVDNVPAGNAPGTTYVARGMHLLRLEYYHTGRQQHLIFEDSLFFDDQESINISDHRFN